MAQRARRSGLPVARVRERHRPRARRLRRRRRIARASWTRSPSCSALPIGSERRASRASSIVLAMQALGATATSDDPAGARRGRRTRARTRSSSKPSPSATTRCSRSISRRASCPRTRVRARPASRACASDSSCRCFAARRRARSASKLLLRARRRRCCPRPSTRAPGPADGPRRRRGAPARGRPRRPLRGPRVQDRVDRYAGHCSRCFRVVSGTLAARHAVAERHHRHAASGSASCICCAAHEHVEVPEAGPGDVVAVAKLKDVHTGHALTARRAACSSREIPIPKGVLSYAIAGEVKGGRGQGLHLARAARGGRSDAAPRSRSRRRASSC